MEPIPETRELFDHLIANGDPDLPAAVVEVADRVEAIVPELVGLSLGIVAEGITMTLVATDAQAAQLDAVQYVDAGPCVAAVERDEVVGVAMGSLLDEGTWLMYAQASAAAGVASSLSLPITIDDEVVGGINMYASTADAFDGQHDAIARAAGSRAEWAVANADLSFSTRLAAVGAVDRFTAQRDVDIAVGVIAARHRISIVEAQERLRQAAARAGIGEVEAARALGHLFTQDS